MKIFNCRSPYTIAITGNTTDNYTKIELKIWKVGDTSPSEPSKIIQKKILKPSEPNYYNISQFVEDYIDVTDVTKYAYNISYETFASESTTEWKSIDEKITILAVKGYNDYFNYNYNYETDIAILIQNKKYDYFYNGFSSTIPYVDIILDYGYANFFRFTYADVNDGNQYHTSLTPTSGIELKRVPLVHPYDALLGIDTIFYVESSDDGETWEVYDEPIYLSPICEPKYNPQIIKYTNRFGGMQTMTFFKKSTESIEVKASDYNTNTFDIVDGYNKNKTLLGQKRIFNKNGNKTIKLNTGFINENQNVDIQDLMLSENILLNNNYAVVIKDTQTTFKNHLNDKLINYEFTFEIASNLINNVI